MKNLWPRVIQWLLVLTLPVILFVANMRLVNGHWFVRWEYGKAGFPPDGYGLTREQRTRLAEVCVDYLAAEVGSTLLADLRLPDGEPAFNERELSHMVDVQVVFQRALAVGIFVALAWTVGMGVLLFRERTRPYAANALWGGGLFTLGLLVAVGAFMALSWWTFFSTFHRLFFAEGTWTFARSDTLIRLFPERFWIDVAVTIVGALVFEAIGFVLVGWIARK